MNCITVKKVSIGAGRPVVCVPIVKDNLSDIVAEAKRLVDEKAQMIEWRADLFKGLGNKEQMKDVLTHLSDICYQTPLLVTIRSKKQGGNSELSNKESFDMYELIAKSGAADLVDIEFFAVENNQKLIKMLRENGVYVVASHHDFDETPGIDTMKMMLERMSYSRADILKLAVMPNSFFDTLNLMSVTKEFLEENPNTILVTMSMGKVGSLSRISGGYTGSAITFATMGEASAPGQMSAEDVTTILDIIGDLGI